MISFEYDLKRSYTAERTKEELTRKRDAIEAKYEGVQPPFEDRHNLRCLETVLDDYILSFDVDEEECSISQRQRDTRLHWQEMFNTEQMQYNEALCIILGINPSAADLLEDDLHLIQNTNTLINKPLSHALHGRHEQVSLRSKFRNKKQVNTKELILWAIDQRMLTQKEVLNTGIKKRPKTLRQQGKYILTNLTERVSH